MCSLSVPLLGISINNIYLDIAPPFGCRTSALACARTMRVVLWLLRQKGFFCLCYLDDFVGLEATKERAKEAYAAFLTLTSQLSLAIALNKCSPPVPSITWLGFAVDANAMTVTLPREKKSMIYSMSAAYGKLCLNLLVNNSRASQGKLLIYPDASNQQPDSQTE